MDTLFLLLLSGLTILTAANIVGCVLLVKRYFVISSSMFGKISLLMFALVFLVLTCYIFLLRVKPEANFVLLSFLFLFFFTTVVNFFILMLKMIDRDKIYDFELKYIKKGWACGFISIPVGPFRFWTFDVKIPEKEYFQKEGLYTRVKIRMTNVFNGCSVAEIV